MNTAAGQEERRANGNPRRRNPKVKAKELDVIYESESEISARKEKQDSCTLPFSLKRQLDDEGTTRLSKKGGFTSPRNGREKLAEGDQEMALEQQTNRFPYNLKGQPVQFQERPSLRQKYGNLLPNHLSLKLGYLHKRLNDKMSCLDRCLKFAVQRGQKKKTFDAVCQIVSSSMKMSVTLTDLRQLIFFQPSLYRLTWIRNQKSMGYNLVINLPVNCPNEEIRKESLRKQMTNQIKGCYTQYLTQKGIPFEQKNINSWGYGFSPDNIQIPLGQLPPDPLDRKLELRNLENTDVSNISNPDLKQIVMSTIRNSSVPPSRQLSSQILNQKTPDAFKNKLYAIIRAKEEKLQQQKKKAAAITKPQIRGNQMARFCQESCQFFISRGVTTVFLASFLEALSKRLQQNVVQVSKLVDHISQSGLQFLQVIPNQKAKMIQIKTDRLNQVLDYYQGK